MDAPPQTSPTTILRPVKSFELKGDIAISLAMHQGDFEGARALLGLILLCEPLNHIDFVVSIAGGIEQLPEMEWLDFYHKATGFFRSVHVNKVRDIRAAYTPSEGNLNRDWRPNNNMFRGVTDYFQHFLRSAGAFYYMEPDCAILQRDWFSKLSAEYQLGRKPFMGVIRQARALSGAALPQHMNGSGFYPNPLVSYSQAAYVASTNLHPEAAPFDVAGGSSIVPLCKPTKLICVDFNANPNINPEAVVWHGDKRNQMKYSMIERFGGQTIEVNGFKVPADDAKRPHFTGDLTSELVKMPDHVASALGSKPDTQLEDVQKAIQNAANSTPRTTPPTNAYEAYLRALKAFGHDKAAWMRAVKDFKANKQ